MALTLAQQQALDKANADTRAYFAATEKAVEANLIFKKAINSGDAAAARAAQTNSFNAGKILGGLSQQAQSSVDAALVLIPYIGQTGDIAYDNASNELKTDNQIIYQTNLVAISSADTFGVLKQTRISTFDNPTASAGSTSTTTPPAATPKPGTVSEPASPPSAPTPIITSPQPTTTPPVVLTGQGSDDSSYNKTTAATIASQKNNTNAAAEIQTNNAAFSGTTSAGAANAGSDTGTSTDQLLAGTKPGWTPDRQQNPLSNFSSSTYQLSLYMITPEAYNAFVKSGRKNINSQPGAYIVAQSGGINKDDSRRAFEFDYYIDDLKLVASINGKDSASFTNFTEINFTIIEPNGFSFVSNLKKAADKLKALPSSVPGYTQLSNATRQMFILGIRFQGYDAKGQILTGNNIFSEDTFNPKSGGVYERLFDITVYDLKFKIDGRTTAYNIKAKSASHAAAFGIKHGRLNNGATVVASTVEEALGGVTSAPDGVFGLVDKLNKTQESISTADIAYSSPTRGNDSFGGTGSGIGTGSNATAAPPKRNTYKVTFIGETADVDLLKNASIAVPDSYSKLLSPMTAITNSAQSVESVTVVSTPNGNQRTLTFKPDTSVEQAITSIIMNSQYVVDALKVVYKNATQPSVAGPNDNPKPPGTDTIKWYNLCAEVLIKGWDPITSDFYYDINYLIQPYDTPAALSVYSNTTTTYYGPHKKYQYWFTGQNSEVISYEHTLNNAYFQPSILPRGTENSQGFGADIPQPPNILVDGNNQSALTNGLQAQNSYVANLKDPGAFARAKISIMGDPDFLMQDSSSSLNSLYSKFYGVDGYTINPNGGQVFIEIEFKEAIDYSIATGLMDINESILFWEYPESIIKAGLKGVSYLVLNVTSNFKQGKFTQDLVCNINTFPDAIIISKAEAAREVALSGQGASQSQVRAVDNAIVANAAPAGIPSVTNQVIPSVTGSQILATAAPNIKGPATANDDAASVAAYSKTKDAILLAQNGGREGLVTVPLNNAGGIIIGKINPNTLLPIR